MTAIGQLQAELQPHKRRHSKTKFTASYGRLGSNGLSSVQLGADVEFSTSEELNLIKSSPRPAQLPGPGRS